MIQRVGWLAEVNWERVVLVLSLAGNAVLGLALFFKSAVNEMLSHWYKERVRRRERSREILRELNHHMTTLQRDYFRMIVSLGLQHMATTEADRALAAQHFEETGRSLRATNEFLERHELKLPQSIRGMVGELRRVMLLPADAVKDVLPSEEIMQRSNAVTTVTDRIRAEVARLVG